MGHYMTDRNNPTKRYVRFHSTITRPPGSAPAATLAQLVPSHWVEDLDIRTVWIRGYRMMRVPPTSFSQGSLLIDIGMVRVLALPGSVSHGYVDRLRVFCPDDNQLHCEIESTGDRVAPGPCLLLLTPFACADRPGDESQAVQRLDQVVGLLVAFQGLNVAHEYLFDNIHTLDGSQTEVWADAIQSPLWLPPPDIRIARLNCIHAASLVIDQLPESDRNRVVISLQWLHRASRLSRVEAFLSYWIAIESLVMKDHGDLVSVKRALERIYGLSAQEAGQRFCIHGIYGVRGRIVHKGELLSITGELLEYVEALYTDLLLDRLGLPSEHRADLIIRSSATPVKELLPK